MSFAYATIYAYIAFTALGALTFQVLSWRGTRRAEAGYRPVAEVVHQHPVHDLKRAA